MAKKKDKKMPNVNQKFSRFPLRFRIKFVSLHPQLLFALSTFLSILLFALSKSGSKMLFKESKLVMKNYDFSQHSILEVAGNFYKRGGKLLVIDEVHKYEGWSREIKEVAETYPDLQMILSGSSLLKLLDGDADLSRRCRGYDMPGLSFRVDYYPLIEQTVNYVVDVELPQQRKVNPVNCRKVKALLNVLAQQVPYEVDISKLATATGLQRNTVLEYLNHLGDAKLINLLFSDITSVKKMQKPDKIFLENPNLLYALATTPVKTGTARECFAVNQLGYGHTVEYGKTQGDFRVDGKWTFELGGENKSFNQIANAPDSFVLSDDIEMPRGSKLPLWMIGFLY